MLALWRGGSGRWSNQLTRMAGRGLLEPRKQGGGVTVVLTDHGRDVLRHARPVHAQAVRTHLLDKLSRADRDTLLRIATRLSD